MAIGQVMMGDVLSVKLVLAGLPSTGIANNAVNRLMYRVKAGSFTTQAAAEAVFDIGAAFVWTGGLAKICRWDWGLQKVIVQKVTPDLEIEYEKRYVPTDNPGLVQVVQGDPAQDVTWNVCFTKKSFRPGRIGIGRTFVGPIAKNVMKDGRPNTALYQAELDAICSTLQADQTMNGLTLTPIIYPWKKDFRPVSDLDAVRQVTTGKYITYLRSRRIGKGM